MEENELDDLRQSFRRLTSALKELATLRLKAYVSTVLLDRVQLGGRASLNEWRSQHQPFKNRLEAEWGRPLELFEKFIITSHQLGSNVNVKYRNVGEENHQFEACIRLHIRSVRISREILTLLKNGYADGALARWRSLYEIALSASFIKKQGNKGAERFLAYKPIQDLSLAESYKKYQDELGIDPITESEISELRESRDELTEEYGNEMDDSGRGWGWAAYKFNGTASPRLVAEYVGLDQFLLYYRWASDAVHGSPKNTMTNLGIYNKTGKNASSPAAGPTNYGFTDPAQLTMICLTEVNSALIEAGGDWKNHIIGQILQNSSDKIAREFYRIQRGIEEFEENKSK